jgi:hypothetical protein
VCHQQLIPSLTSLMLDPYGPVRDATFDCIQVLIEPVRAHSNKMKEEEESRKKKIAAEEKERRDKEGPKVGEITPSKKSNISAALPSANHQAVAPTMSASSSTSSISSLQGSEPPSSAAGGLGFRTSSDSSFWEAIGDDTAGLKAAQGNGGVPPVSDDGWGGGGGWDDGWGKDEDDLDLNDLDDMEDNSSKVAITSPAKPLPPPVSSSPLFASPGSSDAPKKSVQERREEAKQKREGRTTTTAKKLSVEKLSDDVKTDDWEW